MVTISWGMHGECMGNAWGIHEESMGNAFRTTISWGKSWGMHGGIHEECLWDYDFMGKSWLKKQD
jgi:hypothetical protein